MSTVPDWIARSPALRALAEDPALRDLRFLPEDEARKGGEDLAQYYAGNWHLGVLWTPDLWSLCQEIAAGKLLLCEGPEARYRMGTTQRCCFYVDPQHPEELLLAPSPHVPSALFTPVPARADAVRDALAESFPQRRVPRLALPRVERAFMGYLRHLRVPSPYSGELEMAGPHELDRHWNFSPFLDAHCWGSAYADDPWPDDPVPQINAVIMGRKVRAQREGGLCRFTHRSIFSRAQLTTELHVHGLYVWEVRYRPSPHSAPVISRLNERLGTCYPTDMPTDALGATLGFEYMPARLLEARLAEQTDPGAVAAYIDVLCAVRHSDLAVTELLRPYLRHQDERVRGALANAAVRYNWQFLLEDLALHEPEGPLRTFLEEVLQSGIAPPEMTEMGEPAHLYDLMGDGDEDEGSDEDEEDPA